MPFQSYLSERFTTTHENEFFEQLETLLKTAFENSSELVLLLGNVLCNGCSIDAIVLKKDCIAVLECKNYGGKLSFSENGIWTINNTIKVEAASYVNPLFQVKKYRFALADFLKTNEARIIVNNSVKWEHIAGLVLFHQPIQFNTDYIPNNLRTWFDIVDSKNFVQRLNFRVARNLILSDAELLKIPALLGLEVRAIETAIVSQFAKEDALKASATVLLQHLTAIKILLLQKKAIDVVLDKAVLKKHNIGKFINGVYFNPHYQTTERAQVEARDTWHNLIDPILLERSLELEKLKFQFLFEKEMIEKELHLLLAVPEVDAALRFLEGNLDSRTIDFPIATLQERYTITTIPATDLTRYTQLLCKTLYDYGYWIEEIVSDYFDVFLVQVLDNHAFTNAIFELNTFIEPIFTAIFRDYELPENGVGHENNDFVVTFRKDELAWGFSPQWVDKLFLSQYGITFSSEDGLHVPKGLHINLTHEWAENQNPTLLDQTRNAFQPHGNGFYIHKVQLPKPLVVALEKIIATIQAHSTPSNFENLFKILKFEPSKGIITADLAVFAPHENRIFNLKKHFTVLNVAFNRNFTRNENFHVEPFFKKIIHYLATKKLNPIQLEEKNKTIANHAVLKNWHIVARHFSICRDYSYLLAHPSVFGNNPQVNDAYIDLIEKISISSFSRVYQYGNKTWAYKESVPEIYFQLAKIHFLHYSKKRI